MVEGAVFANNEIRIRVVGLYLVDVVDFGAIRKKVAECLFCNDDVFQHSATVGAWVFRIPNENVTAAFNPAAALPRWTVGAGPARARVPRRELP